MAVDAPDRAVTRHILNTFCVSVASGSVARHLAALMRDAGLAEIVVAPWHVLMMDYATGNAVLWLERSVTDAQAAGLITREEGEAWVHEQHEASEAGRFLTTIMAFTVSGRKPA